MDTILNCTVELPPAKEYFQDVSNNYKATFAVVGIVSLVVITIYIEVVVFLHRNNKDRDKWPQEKTKWILAIYPIFCVTSLVGLLIPRSTNVNRLIATVYMSGVIYQFVIMMIGIHGGPAEMAELMQGVRMKIIPLLTCNVFNPPVTRNSIRYLQKTVLIFTVLSALLVYCMAVIWANQQYYETASHNPSLYLNIVTMGLTVFAVWGLRVVQTLSAPSVGRNTLRPKVICMQLVVACNNFQSSFFNILIIAGVLRCDEQLSAESVGLRFHDILIIFEMFLIFLAARFFYRRINDEEDTMNIIENGQPIQIYTNIVSDLQREPTSETPVLELTNIIDYKTTS